MTHIVVTAHGIRTHGAWQTRLEGLLRQGGPDIGVYHFRYGYFSFLAFLVPFLRWLIIRRFRRELRDLVARTSPTRIDIVAHSFGTHIVAWGLRGMPGDAKVHTLVLCGSVLRSTFYWADMVPGRIGRVVNDCGERDGALIMSQLCVLMTGMAGRTGFVGMEGEGFTNRYSDFGHGGYFSDASGRPDDAYMRQNWLPLLTADRPAQRFDSRRDTGAVSGAKLWVINNMQPLKWAVWTSPLIALVAVLATLWLRAELYQTRMAAVSDLAAVMRDRGQLSPEADGVISAVQNGLGLRIGRTDAIWLDDEQENNVRERGILLRWNICFTPARTTAEAVNLIAAQPGRYRLLISDWRRDGDPQAGEGIARELSRLGKPVPLIYYVGMASATEANREAALKLGASAHGGDPVGLFSAALTSLGASPESATAVTQGDIGFFYPLRYWFFGCSG